MPEASAIEFQTTTCRIRAEHLARALMKVNAMSQAAKVALADEVFMRQPNLLTSVLVQRQMGSTDEKMGFLLRLLLVCFQAMKEISLSWDCVTEDEQEKHLQREGVTGRFAESLPADQREQLVNGYLSANPEPFVFAYVAHETEQWLRKLDATGKAAESDQYIMAAALNLAHCIGHARAQPIGP